MTKVAVAVSIFFIFYALFHCRCVFGEEVISVYGPEVSLEMFVQIYWEIVNLFAFEVKFICDWWVKNIAGLHVRIRTNDERRNGSVKSIQNSNGSFGFVQKVRSFWHFISLFSKNISFNSELKTQIIFWNYGTWSPVPIAVFFRRNPLINYVMLSSPMSLGWNVCSRVSSGIDYSIINLIIVHF